MLKRLQKHRINAFARQFGRCCYCLLRMWLDNIQEFAESLGLTLGEAKRLQCTAEHLKARKDGGTDSKDNIAAACLHCNRQRHWFRPAPAPDCYKQLVQKEMRKGRWHPASLVQRLAQ